MENKLGYRLLIVEDDCLMAEGTADYFTGKGWNVKIAEEGQTALELLEQEHFHLILLDVMLPGKNGFTLCRKIRENSDVPIIFITARVLEEDKLNGYALGGDDYVTKPFSLPVLYAKAMALLNRIRGNGTLLKAGRLTVDQNRHKVWNQDRLLELPPKEYAMLLFFLENPGRIYNRDQLLIRFWGYDFDGNERVVDNHIKKLRKILENSGCTITTVRKSGYRMEVEA